MYLIADVDYTIITILAIASLIANLVISVRYYTETRRLENLLSSTEKDRASLKESYEMSLNLESENRRKEEQYKNSIDSLDKRINNAINILQGKPNKNHDHIPYGVSTATFNRLSQQGIELIKLPVTPIDKALNALHDKPNEHILECNIQPTVVKNVCPKCTHQFNIKVYHRKTLREQLVTGP